MNFLRYEVSSPRNIYLSRALGRTIETSSMKEAKGRIFSSRVWRKTTPTSRHLPATRVA